MLRLKGVQISYDFVFPLSEQLNFHNVAVEVERQEITNLVRNRLQDMGIPQEDYGIPGGQGYSRCDCVCVPLDRQLLGEEVLPVLCGHQSLVRSAARGRRHHVR